MPSRKGPPDIVHHAALDARLVKAVRGVKLLALASWPRSLQEPFLQSVARGQPELPQVEYPVLDFGDTRRELAVIAKAADPQHPLGAYLIDSAHSWGLAAGLLESLGTAAVSDYSAQLFGVPDDPMPGNGRARARLRGTSSRLRRNWTANCWRPKNRCRCRPPRCGCSCRTIWMRFSKAA